MAIVEKNTLLRSLKKMNISKWRVVPIQKQHKVSVHVMIKTRWIAVSLVAR